LEHPSPAREAEQHHLDLLYRLLDDRRRSIEGRKAAAVGENDGTPSGRFTRDALQYRYARELAALDAAESKLCFGRIDGADGEAMHIGRIGISDDTEARNQVLMDWRAPLAAPFYTATALDPQGVVRRRHIRTATRQVLSVSDELLQPSDVPGAQDATDDATDLSIGGDAALTEALNAPRTGRMGDIVATIQSEQDAIIRADRDGVLVVQGGPGTGKTVVALHRAAYLLYTYRQRLGSHGVLVIGPSETFLDYIGQVLPSLGETSVVLATIGTLVPGVVAAAADPDGIATLKGRLAMARVIDNAVVDRQRIPHAAVGRRIPYDRGSVTLDADLLHRAQQRAWGSKRPHNRARAVFVRTVLDGLAHQVADRPGVASLDPQAARPDPGEIGRDLAADTTVQAAVSDIWPLITPTVLVDELFSQPDRLAFAAPSLPEDQRGALLRDAHSPLTVSDVPLVDEAAELLGEISASNRSRQAALAEELSFARDTLQALGSEEAGFSDSGIGFTLSMLSAEDIARLHETSGPAGQTADRAAADREWTYGHVIVDEAQELSPMAWRAIFRRCPTRSMTVVGDVAQTSDAAGSSDWAKALNPHARDRWRLAELTVNYRAPGEVMDLAGPVLAAIQPGAALPESVRRTGAKPWVVTAPGPETLADTVAHTVADTAVDMRAGQLAVIHAEGDDDMITAVRGLVPDASGQAGPGHRVVVFDVHQAKGLEFDQVILVEPARIVGSSSHGLGDLYVAMTRATQRLGIVHANQLPAVIHPELTQRR
jgi:DNA helicase IV